MQVSRVALVVLIFSVCLYAWSSSLSGPSWQKKSASEKLATIMSNVNKDHKPYGWYSTVHSAELFIEDMNTSFDTVGDDMPAQGLFSEERPKLIHSVGTVHECKWTSTGNHNYTGIFASGSTNALIRFSMAKEPEPKTPNCVPGISMKFLRDGMSSANLFAMYSLEGQESFNFFKHDLSNHPPNPNYDSLTFDLKALYKAFNKASDFPVLLGLSQLAAFDSQGNKVANPNFPFRLIFHPTSAVHTLFPDAPANNDPDNFVKQIKTISKGTVVYDVYAQQTPTTPIGSYVKIGQVETTTSGDSSKYGDKDLFFQHTRKEDDFKLRPEWVQPTKDILDEQGSKPHWVYPDLPFN